MNSLSSFTGSPGFLQRVVLFDMASLEPNQVAFRQRRGVEDEWTVRRPADGDAIQHVREV